MPYKLLFQHLFTEPKTTGRDEMCGSYI